MKNSLGKSKGSYIQNPSDYYIFAQQDALAIISWYEMKNFIKAVPDGIEVHIPFKSLTVLFEPTEGCFNTCSFDIKTEKDKIMKRFIKDCII